LVDYLTPPSPQAVGLDLDLGTGDHDTGIPCVYLELAAGVDAANFAAPTCCFVQRHHPWLSMRLRHSRQERVPLRIFCTGGESVVPVVLLDMVDNSIKTGNASGSVY
jgi:hypothetical protein